MAKREEIKGRIQRRQLPSKLKKLKEQDAKNKKASGTKYLTGSSTKIQYGQNLRKITTESGGGSGTDYSPSKARKAPKKPSQPKAADTKGITKIGNY